MPDTAKPPSGEPDETLDEQSAPADDARRQVGSLAERLQQYLARRRQGDGGRIALEIDERAVEVEQDERAGVVRSRLPGGDHTFNSTHGTSHRALR